MSAAETVLLEQDEFVDFRGLERINVDDTLPILDAKRNDPNIPNGIVAAVQLLLTRCATSIRFVDLGVIHPPSPNLDWQRPAYKPSMQLAFNDHFGGSESGFKILLNRYREGAYPSQYVLLSPPNEDGTPSNTIFRHDSFTVVGSGVVGLGFNHQVPNPLKTAGVRRYQDGNRHYTRYLFGDSSTPAIFSGVFEQIGFTFSESRYDHEERKRLSHIGGEATKRLSYGDMHFWPQDQFAGQLALLDSVDI